MLTASASGYGSVGSDAFKVVVSPARSAAPAPNNYANGTRYWLPGTTSYDPDKDSFTGTPGWGLRRHLNTTRTRITTSARHKYPTVFTFDGDDGGALSRTELGQDVIVEYVLVMTAVARLSWQCAGRSFDVAEVRVGIR